MIKHIKKIAALVLILTSIMTVNIYGLAYQAYTEEDLEDYIDGELSLTMPSVQINYLGIMSMDTLKELLNNVLENNTYLSSTIDSFELGIEYPTRYASVITINPDYLLTGYERMQADKLIDEILGKIIKPEMTDHEKVKAVHDYIVLNGQYDTSKTYFSDYDLLTRGKSVCNGYALLTYNMLNKLRIPVELVTGSAEGELHVWNLVKLGDYWFHLDTTWNDPAPDTAGVVRYDYYMLTDEEIMKDHTIDAGQNLDTSEISYYDYMHYLSEKMPNGYIYEGIIIDTGLDIYNYQNTASTISELKNMLRNKMESRPTDIYLRLKNDITEAKMSDALADIENYPYVTRVKYYFPMKTDSTGNYNILHAVITYDRIPDRITTDLPPEIYNIDDTVSYKVFAVYGSHKEDITDYVMIHPYGNFINIDEGVMTFSDAGGQDIEFEYGGKTAEVNVTAVNSKGLQYLATAKSSNPVNVKVFDRYIDFSLLNQWPFIENGRTLVPLRAVFEVLNCDVEWDPNIQSAIVEHGSTRIVIPAGMTTAYINGTAVSLDVPAKIVNDRIMVPLRFISEAIEKTVIWDGANSTVLIY